MGSPSRPSTVAGGLALLVVVTLTACGADDPPEARTPTEPAPSSVRAPEPGQEPDESDRAGLAGLGLDDWSTDLDPLADAPAAPDGVAPEEWRGWVEALAGIAVVSATDAEVREARDPRPLVLRRVASPFREVLPEVFATEPEPRLAVVNFFAPQVEVLGEPRVRHVWDVSRRDGEVRVALLVWAAYEVRDGDGPARVVGVTRDFYVLGGQPGAGWETWGNDTCELRVEDRLAPGDPAEERASLARFARTGSARDYAEIEFGDDAESEAERATCRDG